ncbi:MAG: hypothetical protein PSV16_09935 [Flavobacterium sp.]|nr:hypothetical protein [Flavobacterium sp.]
MDSKFIFMFVLPLAILAAGICLSIWSDILKDASTNPLKPYSFANTQLMWWTLIIVCTFCYAYGCGNFEIPKMSNSSLILLGISLGTTTAAKIIDNRDAATAIVRHQDTNNGRHFFSNILSDGNGISVHRFQAFVFNIIFGCMFLNDFFPDCNFIEFNPNELALMGVSSAAYISLKATENK